MADENIATAAVVEQGNERNEINEVDSGLEETHSTNRRAPEAQQNELSRATYHGLERIPHEDDAISRLIQETDELPNDLLAHFAAKILQHQRSHQDPTRNLFKIKNRRRVPDISFKRKQLIEGIWADVKPFHMDQVIVLSSDQHIPTPLSSKCTQIGDLKTLFIPDGSEVLPLGAQAHLSLLRFKVEQVENLQAREPLWVGFRVMATCAELAQEGGVQLGCVIRHCYLHGVLEQPKETAPENYLEHILLVIQVSLLMNDTLHFDAPKRDAHGDLLGDIEWCVEVLTRRESLDEIFGIKIHSLLEVYHAMYHAPSRLARAPGATFAVQDLNIKALRSIGKLSIVWTTTFEDHLSLDLEKMALYVSWFHKPFAWLGVPMDFWQRMMNHHLPRTFVELPAYQSAEAQKLPSDEILLSWAILFATSPIARVRNNDIAALGQPSELAHDNSEAIIEKKLFSNSFSLTQRKASHNIYTPTSPLCPHLGAVDTSPKINTPYTHTGYLTMTDAALNQESVSYSKFPVYESRIRELRSYIDACSQEQKHKPRGLKQVWSENRGGLSYYTLWVLILLGGLGILLAFFGLAVGIAQAVAGFRVLGLVDSGAVVRTG